MIIKKNGKKYDVYMLKDGWYVTRLENTEEKTGYGETYRDPEDVLETNGPFADERAARESI